MIKRVFVSSLIALLLMSTFALAAGSSTGGANTRPNNLPTSESDTCQIGTPGCPDRNGVQVNEVYRICESKTTVAERIKCRFNNSEILKQGKDYLPNAVEEACRDSEGNRRKACQELYERSSRCYGNLEAVEKKRCFLKESGININAGGTFRAAPDETKRNYVVLLLYELQEKIEAMQEQGKITTEQASSLIEKIVEMKKMILAGAKRADIVPKMQAFKEEYRFVVSGASE